MNTFNPNELYYLLLYVDKDLTSPEISTLNFLEEFQGPGNKAIYEFKSVEDNDPPQIYRFHDGAESVHTFEELVIELNEASLRKNK